MRSQQPLRSASASRLAVTIFVVLGAGTAGCHSSAYCQSGAKHGTQCYSSPVGDDPPAREADEESEPPPPNPVPPTTPR